MKWWHVFTWRRLSDKALLARAKRGCWRYGGLRGVCPGGWPTATVQYPDGGVSYPMPLGNAVGYAEIFGGTVKVIRP